MKHLRTKLLAAVAMLAIAAIMMTTASYAWFTISTNPEISDIKAQVTSNGNLEIQLVKVSGTDAENTYTVAEGSTNNGTTKTTKPAASAVGDAGKNQTWGNLIDLEEYFTTAGTKITLKPVQAVVADNAAHGGQTINGNSKYIAFFAPDFALDGRIKSLSRLTRTGVAASTSSNIFNDYRGGIYTFNNGTGTGEVYTGNDAAWCFEIDFWMRTNINGAYVELSDEHFRDSQSSGANAERGLGSYIRYDGNTNKDLVTIKIVEYQVAQTVSYANGATSTITEATTGNVHSVNIGAVNADGNNPLTLGAGNRIALTKDVYKLVKVYVYMDGEGLTNADMLNTVAKFALNIQFKLMTSDEATATDVTVRDMQPTQTQYSANAANTDDEDAAKRADNAKLD